jgi:peptidoglycan LD-endopeptidase LytH
LRPRRALGLLASLLLGAACLAATELDDLRSRNLVVPVDGIAPSALVDTYAQARGEKVHEALDIPALRGTPVRAVQEGRVVKLFNSRAGGLTIYQFDPSSRYAYYYAHLDRYAPGLREGDSVQRGQLIGYVGTTGNAAPDSPHLHFAIFRLGEGKRWWQGTPLNPYQVWSPGR